MKHLQILAALIAAFVVCGWAQTTGPIQAKRVKNSTCTVGQVATYDAAGKLSGCSAGSGGGFYQTIQDATPADQTQRAKLRVVGSASTGAVVIVTDNAGANVTQVQINNDMAVVASRTQTQIGTDSFLALTSSSGTAFVGSVVGNAITSLVDGMPLRVRVNANCGASPTLDVDGGGPLTPKRLYAADGTAPVCVSGTTYGLVYHDGLTTTTVNTSGTVVTGTAGAAFASDMVGTQVKIGSTFYVVAAFTNATSITLGSSAGSQTGVTLAAGGWVFPATGGGASITRGAFASLPSCTTSGQVYLFTDSRYASAHCNGSTWQYVLPDGRLVTLPPTLTLSGNTGSTGQSTTSGGIYLTWANSATGSVYLSESIAGSFTRSIYVEPMWLNNDSDGHFSIQVTDGANQQELFVGNDATSEKVMVRCAAGGGGYTPQVTYTTAGIKRLLLKPSMHLRVSSDGTNLTYAIGDGVSWFTVHTGAKSVCSVGTISAIRFQAYHNTGGSIAARHWIGAWQ